MSIWWVLCPVIAALVASRLLVALLRLCVQMVAKDLPGPPALPLIGNLHQMLGLLRADKLYELAMGIAERYGTVCRIWAGPYLIVFVSNPQDIEFLLTKPQLQSKSAAYEMLRPLVGEGLVVLNGHRWRRHRKLITPSLHRDALTGFVEVFDRKATELVNSLPRSKPFDAYPSCLRLTIDTSLETIMNVAARPDDTLLNRLKESFPERIQLFMHRLSRPWLTPDCIFRLVSAKAARRFHDVVGLLDVITERVLQNGKKTRVFLDRLAAELPAHELHEEAKTLLTASAETSSQALSFVLQVLALHQDVQEKIYEELQAIGLDASRPVTPVELRDLQYVEQVIKETLRLFPVIAYFARDCRSDVELPSGYRVPAGASLVAFLPHLHRLPESFPDPESFNPDRFQHGESSYRHPFSYVPFSAGSRNCIASRYAMQFLKTAVARVVLQYRVLPASPDGEVRTVKDIPLRLTFGLSVRGGVQVRLEERAQPAG